ncbi:serine--tRNA ligase [Candidatus Kaiserbacteria bacterium RIFCSPHIGHO2_01_FULL_48_10]|uniref:Serine--tRNA ligase n=1 Tax=Candidatus Kaiserbacteria bacterium RIFCSPHIGHO2_01_FULL_48_10 TaxID=1798476 RepID=A0A1F6C6N4_9BACT|nr:MAG: serine--tRNA ligase [Candidatus Kaiserbacteria bacterium RIFCSPHIGHO2_01_FULL_48_10]HLC99634.1 serine--tRNA ligase [Patescibacteria group bacterium]
MLDIKFIRENPEKVKEGLKKKKATVGIVDELLDFDKKWRGLTQEIEELRSTHKADSKRIAELAGAEKKTAILQTAKQKEKMEAIEKKLKMFEEEVLLRMQKLPNLPLDDVPAGKDESDNVALREVGKKPTFNFTPKEYLPLAESLDLIDVERAAKVSGSRFGYIKNEAAQLEFALVQLAFQKLIPKGFSPIVPPVIIKEEMMNGMGYVDTEQDRQERYFFESDRQYLVGTAEQSVGPMYAKEMIPENKFPLRFAAFSPCFRREAGSYGKDTKGILRVHQFDKIEMFSFVRPEQSTDEHKLFVAIEEELMKDLELPYRVVQLCTGDLSRPSASTVDIETWFPGQNGGKGLYRETHSSSNCTDFQARRLQIKYRDADGKNSFVHTVNGTAFAVGRILAAIIENNQADDGSIRIPKALLLWMNGKTAITHK